MEEEAFEGAGGLRGCGAGDGAAQVWVSEAADVEASVGDGTEQDEVRL